MARLNMFYYKSFGLFFILLFGNVYFSQGQGNCLMYPEDSGERIACELSYRAIEYDQGSKESQQLFDQAIKVGPKYAWAYYEKSVPFFKYGLLAEGVSLISKAIELEPQNYLDYRAYWYFYNRSYAHCIKDLEELYIIHKTPYTSTPGGDMEMRLLLAMAHAQTGNVPKGINWILTLLDYYKEQPHLKGDYDHFCLGVLYYLNDELVLAESELKMQLATKNNFADTYYYLGLVNQKLGKDAEAKTFFQGAFDKFEGKDDGYSVNIFADFNLSKAEVEKMLLD